MRVLGLVRDVVDAGGVRRWTTIVMAGAVVLKFIELVVLKLVVVEAEDGRWGPGSCDETLTPEASVSVSVMLVAGDADGAGRGAGVVDTRMLGFW